MFPSAGGRTCCASRWLGVFCTLLPAFICLMWLLYVICDSGCLLWFPFSSDGACTLWYIGPYSDEIRHFCQFRQENYRNIRGIIKIPSVLKARIVFTCVNTSSLHIELCKLCMHKYNLRRVQSRPICIKNILGSLMTNTLIDSEENRKYLGMFNWTI